MLIGLDLDGTLLDSRPRHMVALLQVAEALAVSLSESDAHAYFRLKCNGANGIEALRQLGIPAAEDISRGWIEIIESEEMLALDLLYPDTLDTLNQQRARSNAFVLVTSRQNPAAVQRQIAMFGLEEYLEEIVIVDPRDSVRTKAAVTRHHNLSVIVGDTEIDCQWAKDLGAKFYASSFGFRSQSYWQKRQISSYPSLTAIFASIVQSDRKELFGKVAER